MYNSCTELWAMEAQTCCLCHDVTGDQKGKNRRKKLCGEPCAAEQKRLSDFCCSLYNASFESIFADKTSVVCYMCIQKLAKLIKMKTESSRLKGDIPSYLETIWQTLAVSTATLQKRKQNGNDTYSGRTPTKVPRTTCHPHNVSVRILQFYYNVNSIYVYCLEWWLFRWYFAYLLCNIKFLLEPWLQFMWVIYGAVPH